MCVWQAAREVKKGGAALASSSSSSSEPVSVGAKDSADELDV